MQSYQNALFQIHEKHKIHYIIMQLNMLLYIVMSVMIASMQSMIRYIMPL